MHGVIELQENPLLHEPWYYSVELAPGVVTPGLHGHSAILTRAMLKGCEAAGQRCLDIGPMEGLISAVLARRGAASITAIDVTAEHAPKLDLISSALNFKIEMIAPLRLSKAPDYFRGLKTPAFDLVVFSGVLYHVLDIATALMAVRSLVRTGGLVVIESWLKLGDAGAADLNMQGRFTKEPNTFWFLDVAAFDYLLRLLWMKPLDCAYCLATDGVTLRLATVCAAVDAPSDIDDPWMHSARIGSVDISAMPDEALQSLTRRELTYRGASNALTIQAMMRKREPTSLHLPTLWLTDTD